jgi:dUTP pyrophosphatase
MIHLEIQNEHLQVLKYATPSAAAMDLRAVTPDNGNAIVTLEPGATAKIGTGIRLNMPHEEMAALILPRSSLGSQGIVLANTIGLIDADYQGEIIVALKNTSHKDFHVQTGDRIAQLMFIPVIRPRLITVSHFVTTTERGTGGFGSTGVK